MVPNRPLSQRLALGLWPSTPRLSKPSVEECRIRAKWAQAQGGAQCEGPEQLPGCALLSLLGVCVMMTKGQRLTTSSGLPRTRQGHRGTPGPELAGLWCACWDRRPCRREAPRWLHSAGSWVSRSSHLGPCPPPALGLAGPAGALGPRSQPGPARCPGGQADRTERALPFATPQWGRVCTGLCVFPELGWGFSQRG